MLAEKVFTDPQIENLPETDDHPGTFGIWDTLNLILNRTLFRKDSR